MSRSTGQLETFYFTGQSASFNEGWEASVTGSSITSNPYAQGSDDYTAWNNGFMASSNCAFSPDDIMEAAKRLASRRPDTIICTTINDREEFEVCYNATADNFECTRRNQARY